MSADNVVFVTRRPPFPFDNGARIRTDRLVRALAERFRVTLVSFEHARGGPDGSVSADVLRQSLPEVEVVLVPGLGADKRLQQLRSLAARRSWAFGRYRTPALAQALRAIVERRAPGVVHLDDPGVGVPLAPGVRVAFAPHNVEHRIVRGEGESETGVRRAFAAVEARKIAREERALWRTADVTLAVSEVDAATMRAGGARRVELCPNGTDPVAPLPDPPPLPAVAPLRLVFVGSGNYGPYERGLAWLVREVLPRVRGVRPVELEVVGRPPNRPVQAEGVRYTGVVPSVRPHYEHAHVVVVPVFEGSGTRLKVIEALAQRRPVVSTTLGAEGLGVEPGVHYWGADTVESFAAALLELGRAFAEPGDPQLVRRLDAGRRAAEQLFWPRIGAGLAQLYAELARA